MNEQMQTILRYITIKALAQLAAQCRRPTFNIYRVISIGICAME